MVDVVFALGPIFLLILLGAVLKRKQWVDDAFWAPAELLTYYVFFPALLFRSISNADMAGLDVIPMAMALLCGLFVVAALALLSKRLMILSGPAVTSVFQGSIRPNTYVGVAAAAGLWGDPGLTLVAIAIAFVVPTVNILSATVMTAYTVSSLEKGRAAGRIVEQILKNPIVLACAAGGVVNVSGGQLPPVIDPLFTILASAALPIGLLAVGAGLNLSAMKAHSWPLAASSMLKLVCLPAMTALACFAIGVEGLTALVAITYAALPVSASSYVLARTMGGDADLMAGIITFTTLVSMLTMPVVVLLMGMT